MCFCHFPIWWSGPGGVVFDYIEFGISFFLDLITILDHLQCTYIVYTFISMDEIILV